MRIHSKERSVFSNRVLGGIGIAFLILMLEFTTLASAGQLTLNKNCGDLVCGSHFYCSLTDHTCKPCESICDPAHYNLDQSRCESDCQDYLHDLRYTQMDSVEFSNQLWTLKLMIASCIGLTVVVMLISIGIFVKLTYKKRTKILQMKPIAGKTVGNAKDKTVVDIPSVIYNPKYIEPPQSQSVPVSAPTTGNPINNRSNHNNHNNNNNNNQTRFRREPSESILPEYSNNSSNSTISISSSGIGIGIPKAGYDNPALAPSPTHSNHI